MILLVTGGRDFNNFLFVDSVLRSINEATKIDLVVHGAARGLDSAVSDWCKFVGIHQASIPALWDHLGNPAGAIRNSIMSKLNIDLCVAFPGGKGTADMVKKAKKKGVVVISVSVIEENVNLEEYLEANKQKPPGGGLL